MRWHPFLRRVAPDAVAFQEIDGASWWSGGFDHLEHLSEGAGLQSWARADNAAGFGIRYGTALASRATLSDARAITFAPSPPTPAKGFVLATLQREGLPAIDLVSVHLDFSRASIRRAQVKRMVKVIGTPGTRSRPLVVLGDMNSKWPREPSDTSRAVKVLAEALGLTAHAPEADAESDRTFANRSVRIDWILISADLEFVDYEVFPDILSDHQPVLAEVKLR